MQYKTTETITNKKNEKKRRLINVSLVVFAISIVTFAVIGALVIDNFSHLQQVEELSQINEGLEKKDIDERLRLIALQEENAETLKETIKKEEELLKENTDSEIEEPEEITKFLKNKEEVKKTKFTEYNEKYRKKENGEETSFEQEQISEKKLQEIPFKKDTLDISALNMKVVVGNYVNREDAEAELAKISSQFSAPPFIKLVNGKFAIQVAAFKTPETAHEFVNSLRQQGFNARIIEE